MPADAPAIYCLDLASHPQRRERMERRLRHHGLLDHTTFVEAVNVEGPADRESAEWRTRAARACGASHLKAIRAMLADPGAAVAGAIVCEGDVLLHNEFAGRLAAVTANMPLGTPLVSLGYALDHWHRDFTWAGRRPQERNLCRLVPAAVWCSHMYWISPAYAQRVLDLHGETPVDELTPITEHLVIHPSGGVCSWPPLALQDVIDSTIRPREELRFHFEAQRFWPYSEYAAGEPDPPESPLAETNGAAEAKSIGLCMIVRDEAAVIERCLESMLPLIDTWTICDTGSTDGTPGLIEELLADVPGRLHHREFRDFGTTRTELMELAAGSADYLLLVDADQTLERRGPLPPLEADAYLLRYAGGLDYAVPRLVRGDRRWWYEGSTHEYLATEGEHGLEVLEGLAVHHHADSGTRSEKLERDTRLLERDLDANPEDVRATFYLAQTLRDRGETERAIALYRRRVELGGWDEEVFYAAYQAGVVTGWSDPEAAIPLLEAAFERRPSRAEPLHELSRLCRQLGRHRDAYEYARRGLDVPYPEDLLFVHRDVYEWGLAFELAVAAFWIGEVEEAFEVNERLLEEGRMPGEFAAAASANRDRCLEALPARHPARASRAPRLEELLRGGFDVGEVRLEVEPAWPQFNPTIAADGDGFRMIVRTSNYRLVNGVYHPVGNDSVIRTLNYLVELDGSLELREVSPLVDTDGGPPRYPSWVEGWEDLRLTQTGGRWLALAAARDRNADAVCEIALLGLEANQIDDVRMLPGPEPGRHEKNWMPFVAGDELRIVYSTAPTVVFRCDPASGQLQRLSEHSVEAELPELRGGSQGVPVPGGHMFVVHEAHWHGPGRRYHHRFVLIDDDHRLAGLSRPFTFTGNAIELCAGLASRGNDLVLTFGVGDRAAAIGICDCDQAMGLLDSPHGGSGA